MLSLMRIHNQTPSITVNTDR